MAMKVIDYLGIDRVLKRGSGEIIAEQDEALLIRDSIGKAYFPSCDDETIGIELFDRFIGQNCDLLMTTNVSKGEKLFSSLSTCTMYKPLEHPPEEALNAQKDTLTKTARSMKRETQ